MPFNLLITDHAVVVHLSLKSFILLSSHVPKYLKSSKDLIKF